MTDFKKWFAARARNPDKITLEEAFSAGVSVQQRAQPAPSAPDGWKLVPIEPTIAMCLAGDKPRLQIGDSTPTPAIYRAMIAAAPEAKP